MPVMKDVFFMSKEKNVALRMVSVVYGGPLPYDQAKSRTNWNYYSLDAMTLTYFNPGAYLPTKCPFVNCSRSLRSPSDIYEHFYEKHVDSDQRWSCTEPDCVYEASSVELLAEHMGSHSNPDDREDSLELFMRDSKRPDRPQSKFQSKKTKVLCDLCFNDFPASTFNEHDCAVSHTRRLLTDKGVVTKVQSVDLKTASVEGLLHPSLVMAFMTRNIDLTLSRTPCRCIAPLVTLPASPAAPSLRLVYCKECLRYVVELTSHVCPKKARVETPPTPPPAAAQSTSTAAVKEHTSPSIDLPAPKPAKPTPKYRPILPSPAREAASTELEPSRPSAVPLPAPLPVITSVASVVLSASPAHPSAGIPRVLVQSPCRVEPTPAPLRPPIENGVAHAPATFQPPEDTRFFVLPPVPGMDQGSYMYREIPENVKPSRIPTDYSAIFMKCPSDGAASPFGESPGPYYLLYGDRVIKNHIAGKKQAIRLLSLVGPHPKGYETAPSPDIIKMALAQARSRAKTASENEDSEQERVRAVPIPEPMVMDGSRPCRIPGCLIPGAFETELDHLAQSHIFVCKNCAGAWATSKALADHKAVCKHVVVGSSPTYKCPICEMTSGEVFSCYIHLLRTHSAVMTTDEYLRHLPSAILLSPAQPVPEAAPSPAASSVPPRPDSRTESDTDFAMEMVYTGPSASANEGQGGPVEPGEVIAWTGISPEDAMETNDRPSSAPLPQTEARAEGRPSSVETPVHPPTPKDPDPSDGLVCPVCFEEATRPAAAAMHLMQHITEAKCPLCDEQFPTESTALSHLQRSCVKAKIALELNEKPKPEADSEPAKPVEAFGCEVCGQDLKTLAALTNHALIHSSEMISRCVLCGKAVSDASALLEHAEADHSDLSVKAILQQLSEFIDDRLSKKTVRKLSQEAVVEIMAKMFPSQNADNAQARTQEAAAPGDDSVEISIVHDEDTGPAQQQRVLAGQALEPEAESDEDDDLTIVDEPKPTQAEDGVIKHPPRAVPAREPKHKCGVCGQLFFTTISLGDHMLQHAQDAGGTTDEIHPVPLGHIVWICRVCSIAFGQKADFRAHFAKHTKFVSCNACTSVCPTSDLAQTHMATHKNPNHMFGCFQCSAGFRNEYSLHCHMAKVHSWMLLWVCKECSFGCTSQQYVVQHVHTDHKKLLQSYNVISQGIEHALSQLVGVCAHRKLHYQPGSKDYVPNNKLEVGDCAHRSFNAHSETSIICTECGTLLTATAFLSQHSELGGQMKLTISRNYRLDFGGTRMNIPVATVRGVPVVTAQRPPRPVAAAMLPSQLPAGSTTAGQRPLSTPTSIRFPEAGLPIMGSNRPTAPVTTAGTRSDMSTVASASLRQIAGVVSASSGRGPGRPPLDGDSATQTLTSDHRCGICHQNLKSSAGLKVHMLQHPPFATLFCLDCGDGMMSDLKRHAVVAHKNKVEKMSLGCQFPKCTFVSPYLRAFLDHLKTHKGGTPCASCRIPFYTHSALGQHRSIGCKGYCCIFCGRQSSADATDHVAEHALKHFEMCRQCGICFLTRNQALTHFTSYHCRNGYCSICKSSLKAVDVEAHMVASHTVSAVKMGSEITLGAEYKRFTGLEDYIARLQQRPIAPIRRPQLEEVHAATSAPPVVDLESPGKAAQGLPPTAGVSELAARVKALPRPSSAPSTAKNAVQHVPLDGTLAAGEKRHEKWDRSVKKLISTALAAGDSPPAQTQTVIVGRTPESRPHSGPSVEAHEHEIVQVGPPASSATDTVPGRTAPVPDRTDPVPTRPDTVIVPTDTIPDVLSTDTIPDVISADTVPDVLATETVPGVPVTDTVPDGSEAEAAVASIPPLSIEEENAPPIPAISVSPAPKRSSATPSVSPTERPRSRPASAEISSIFPPEVVAAAQAHSRGPTPTGIDHRPASNPPRISQSPIFSSPGLVPITGSARTEIPERQAAPASVPHVSTFSGSHGSPIVSVSVVEDSPPGGAGSHLTKTWQFAWVCQNETCSFIFKRMGYLQNHQYAHRTQAYWKIAVQLRGHESYDDLELNDDQEADRRAKCEICGEQLTLQAIVRHLRLHHEGVGYFPCTECSEHFDRPSDCDYHQFSMHADVLRQESLKAFDAAQKFCSICNFRGVTMLELETHIGDAHKTTHADILRLGNLQNFITSPKFCVFCDFSSIFSTELEAHIFENHLVEGSVGQFFAGANQVAHLCLLCGLPFMDEKSLEIHILHHKENLQGSNTTVKFGGLLSYATMRVREVSPNGTTVICDHCGEKLASTALFMAHVWENHLQRELSKAKMFHSPETESHRKIYCRICRFVQGSA